MRRLSFLPYAVLGLAVALVGCATPSSTLSPEDRAAAVGVWEYQTSGSHYLGRGTLRIRARNGRLEAVLRDTRKGRLNAHVVQRGSRIEMELFQLRISGRIEDDKIVGFYRRPKWDVSTTQDFRPHRRPSDSGSIVAHRVRTPGWSGNVFGLDCTSILVETTYRCSASSHR